MNPKGSQFDADFASKQSPAELAGQLLEQSFAVQNGFGRMHLDEIETFFSETQPAESDLPSTFDAPAADRTLALNYFCFLLFSMESHGSADSGESLQELAGREEGTRVISQHGFKLPKPPALNETSASQSPQDVSAESTEGASLNESLPPQPDQDLPLGSEFDGPFQPNVDFSGTSESDLTPVKENDLKESADDLFDESAPRVLAENTIDPWTEGEKANEAEETPAAPPSDPWSLEQSALPLDEAIQPVWDSVSETVVAKDDVVPDFTVPDPLTGSVDETEPDTITNFAAPAEELLTASKKSPNPAEATPVEAINKKLPTPPPPPVKAMQRKAESAAETQPQKVAATKPAEALSTTPVKSTPVATPTVKAAPVVKKEEKIDLETPLELEDNNWIERQFAGIANQLAVDTSAVSASDEMAQEIEDTTNTASVIVEFKKEEVAAAVADEFGDSQATGDLLASNNVAEDFSETTLNEELKDDSQADRPAHAEDSEPGVLSPVSESLPTPGPERESPVTRALCADAKEYVAVAGFLETFLQRTDLGFPGHHLARLSAQSLCHATEAEWLNHFFKGLKHFWKDRASAIGDLLDSSAKPARLHPVIKSAIDSIADANRGWLADDKFPHAAVVASLQYMLGFEDVEKAKLTLLDMGTLLFFFGAARTLGGVSLSNHLGVVGLDTDLALELAFRLTRMHRLRSRSNSIKKPFSQADLLLMSQDAMRCVALLSQSHSEDSALHAIQVA